MKVNKWAIIKYHIKNKIPIKIVSEKILKLKIIPANKDKQINNQINHHLYIGHIVIQAEVLYLKQ